MPPKNQRKFWASIRNSPDDDVPRLAYADWLDVHGDPDRAEFIRVQCELAKLGPDRRKGRKDRIRLEPREQALWADNGDQWLAPFHEVLRESNPLGFAKHSLDRVVFRRGFFAGPYFGLEATRRLAAAGDQVEPVDQVNIMECGANYRHESVVEISNWSGAGCIVCLSLAWGSDDDIAAIVRSEHLRNLRYLGIWNGKLTDIGMAMLADWPFAAALNSMDFKENAITDAGAFALADSQFIGTLRWLDLHRTQIGSAGQERLRERFGNAVQM